jgi:CheY-like chemotaxis protein
MTSPRTILYVEDDAVTLTAYRRRLESVGFTVEPACDGIQAVKFLSHSIPGLVLLDLVLPKFDGEEVLKIMYDNPRLDHIPVIILSTNTVVSLANEMVVEKAARRFLKSTCTFQVLHQAIEQVFTEAEAAQAARSKDQKPHACPATVPKIFRQLQLNIRGIDPMATHPLSPYSPGTNA